MTPDELARPLVELLAPRPSSEMFFVALDGRSGSGKSTLADAVATSLGNPDGPVVEVIRGDDFYAGGSARTWDRRSPEEKAARCIDWRRQRALLTALRENGAAAWHPFDWEAEDWDGDEVPLTAEPAHAVARSVVVLEGAYSARPELHDLLDLRVLLDPPDEVRREQLLRREGEAYRSDWEHRWSAAEDHYFRTIMPPTRFDLVLGRNGNVDPAGRGTVRA